MSTSSQPPEFLKSVIAARDAAPRSSEQQKRARVTLTYAQSLDAKIAGAGGRQLTISGNESMTMTHWLAAYDASGHHGWDSDSFKRRSSAECSTTSATRSAVS
ncbi:2,5-diamino-6-(ribosylamino)-4(3H)-pyrimidinone 5'-phosphate reductase [Ceratobasidium sp. 394]|nr:2,5-diamino-6-(ribosylamino)-4(3H)-pyrimidinone 5'-phosphate reductase [Ceratobasidium sp. 394]